MLGDARLTLAESADKYDLIVLDAFLLRRDPDPPDDPRGDGDLCVEARAGRHRADAHLQPPLELASVVAGIAQANGLVSRQNNRAAREGEDDCQVSLHLER